MAGNIRSASAFEGLGVRADTLASFVLPDYRRTLKGQAVFRGHRPSPLLPASIAVLVVVGVGACAGASGGGAVGLPYPEGPSSVEDSGAQSGNGNDTNEGKTEAEDADDGTSEGLDREGTGDGPDTATPDALGNDDNGGTEDGSGDSNDEADNGGSSGGGETDDGDTGDEGAGDGGTEDRGRTTPDLREVPPTLSINVSPGGPVFHRNYPTTPGELLRQQIRVANPSEMDLTVTIHIEGASEAMCIDGCTVTVPPGATTVVTWTGVATAEEVTVDFARPPVFEPVVPHFVEPQPVIPVQPELPVQEEPVIPKFDVPPQPGLPAP